MLAVVPVILLAGCETTTPSAREAIELGPTASNAQLVRVAKLEFQSCTASFYENQWKQVSVHVTAMKDLAQRLEAQPAPNGQSTPFSAATQSYATAVESLQASVSAEDVVKTTLALRQVAAALAELTPLVGTAAPAGEAVDAAAEGATSQETSGPLTDGAP